MGSHTPPQPFYLTRSPLSAQWTHEISCVWLINQDLNCIILKVPKYLHLHLLWGWRLLSMYGSLRVPESTRWRRNKSPTPPQCTRRVKLDKTITNYHNIDYWGQRVGRGFQQPHGNIMLAIINYWAAGLQIFKPLCWYVVHSYPATDIISLQDMRQQTFYWEAICLKALLCRMLTLWSY